jgi:hypothetical protein
LNVGKFIAHGKSDIQDEITFTISNNDKTIPPIAYNIALFWVDFLYFTPYLSQTKGSILMFG